MKLAGADGEGAKLAAEEVAGYDNRIADLKGEFISLRGEFLLVEGMLGFNLAMTVALVGKAFLSAH